MHNVFSADELQPSVDAVADLVDQIAARLQRGGRVADTFPTADFLTRLTLLEQAFPGASVLLHKNGVLPRAIADLWTHPRLLSVRPVDVESYWTRLYL